MKALCFVILTLMLSCGTAAAQDTQINDILFLTEPDSWEDCVRAEFLDHITMGVYLRCPSYPFISGLEFGLSITGRTNTSLIPDFPVGPSPDLNWDTDQPGFVDIRLMFSSPLTATETLLLGTIDVFYLDAGELDFTLTAASPSSLAAPAPLYVGDPGRNLVPLARSPLADPPDFVVNGDCGSPWNAVIGYICGPLPDHQMSWGAVKSLYR